MLSIEEGRGTQVVRERSAKPLYVGSIPTRASSLSVLHFNYRLSPQELAAFSASPRAKADEMPTVSSKQETQQAPAPGECIQTSTGACQEVKAAKHSKKKASGVPDSVIVAMVRTS